MLSKAINVATDCSGMEAPIQALHNLKANVSHVFACDINKHVITTVEANFAPNIMYENFAPDAKLEAIRARAIPSAVANESFLALFCTITLVRLEGASIGIHALICSIDAGTFLGATLGGDGGKKWSHRQ